MECLLHMITTCAEFAQRRNWLYGSPLLADLNLVPLILFWHSSCTTSLQMEFFNRTTEEAGMRRIAVPSNLLLFLTGLTLEFTAWV